MPANKNQHYVPQCYLKPYTLNGKGRAINLIHINSEKIVSNAPTKGQCSKDYLYGKDQVLEKILKETEDIYGIILGKIKFNKDLKKSDLEELKAFAWLQFCRTEKAFDRLRKAKESMHEATYRGYEFAAEEIDLSEKTIVQSSMLRYAKTLPTIRDLEVCIIHNQTKLDFVTSDDPAILTNRFQIQRLQVNNSGIGSAGAMLFLPLTPRHMLMCFDADVYRFEKVKGDFVVNRKTDVQAFNQFQYIKAENNIYYFNASDESWIMSELQNAKPLRPSIWHIVSTALVTHEKLGRTYIREATQEETLHAKRRIVSLRSVLPQPERWPSIIKYKLKPRYFWDGSMVGYLRLTAAKDMYMQRYESIDS